MTSPVVVEKYADEGLPIAIAYDWLLARWTRATRWGIGGQMTPTFCSPTCCIGGWHRYCVGEPWNQQAVFKGIGVPVITDYEIWKDNPEKVFGMTKEFTEKYPNTTARVVKALIRAAKWLDENDNANRMEAVVGALRR